MTLGVALGLSTALACIDLSGYSTGSGLDGGSVPEAAADVVEGGESDADADADAMSGALCPPIAISATCDPGLLSDAANCCVAGRSCGGGTCVAGKCQPVTVVPDATTDARGIAIHGDTIVWATGCSQRLRRVQTDGTGNSALPPGANCTPTISLSGVHAYWIEYNGPFLMKTAIDGSGAASIVAEVRGDAGVRASFARLATDTNHAYWATTSPPGVWHAPLNGDHVTPSALASASGLTKETVTMPYGVAVDGAHVYWADPDGNALKRRALSSLGTDVLAEVVTAEPGPRDLALDATRVYWLTAGGAVRARAKDLSANAVTLATQQTGAESIIVDDRYVYWTTFVKSGTVSRVAKTGGLVEVLAGGQKNPYALTQDCTTVYWTNQNDFNTGEIMRVSK